MTGSIRGATEAKAAGRVTGPAEAKALGILNKAREHLGYAEGPNNANKFTQRVMGDPNQPWCAAFVSTVLKDSGFNIPGSASTRTLASQFEQRGQYFARGTKQPQPGDVIFYGGRGGENHTGIVQKVENGKVYTIEGNWSDKVSQRVLSLDDPGIGGYGRVVDGPVANDVGVDVSGATRSSAGRPSARQTGRGTATRATSSGVDALSYLDTSNAVLKAIIEAMLNDNARGLAAALGERYPYVSTEDLDAAAAALTQHPELAARIASKPELLDQLVADPSPENIKRLTSAPTAAAPTAETQAFAKQLISSENFTNRDAALAQLAPFLKQVSPGGWSAFGKSQSPDSASGWVR